MALILYFFAFVEEQNSIETAKIVNLADIYNTIQYKKNIKAETFRMLDVV